jgi:hypothetical protein
MAKDNIEQKQILIDLMNMKTQTAVEWLVEEINKLNVSTEARGFINKLEKQAKEMEKQQIIEAHIQGHNAPSSTIKIHDAEQYYNETFKKE